MPEAKHEPTHRLAGAAQPAPPTPQPRKSATDQVFEALYEAVISLKLPPGTKVSEVEVAAQLGVSRQPVRDAFFRLSKLGFLAIRPQRATLITPISPQAVLDAVFVRIALEVECLRVAAPLVTDADIARLRAILMRQKQAVNDKEPTVFYALDEELHAAISEIAGHGHAWNLIQEQKAHMDRVRYLTLSAARRRHVLDEHGGIVDALAARDATLAEARLRAHLSDLPRVLADIRAAHPDYFEPDSPNPAL